VWFSVPQPYVYIVILWLDFLTEASKEYLSRKIEKLWKVIESYEGRKKIEVRCFFQSILYRRK
jgi:hypothetical protein